MAVCKNTICRWKNRDDETRIEKQIQDGRKLDPKHNRVAYEESERQIKIEEKDTEKKIW